MNYEWLIGVAFFVATAYSIKVVVEARTRAKMISANVSQELLQSMLATEERQRRHGSLRWGIVLCCLAVGFFIIQMLELRDAVPAAIALVLGATGVGNLAYYMIAHRDEPRTSGEGTSD